MTRAPLLVLLLAGSALAAPAWAQGLAPNAQPSGGRVAAGSASITQGANRTTINQTSNRAVLEWQQFNLGSAQTVEFQQPDRSAWTLNRVTGGDPSVIAGRIVANGGVALVNQSGVVFAEGAQVNVGSLIAAAANITDANFMAGRMVFDGAPRPGARVENRGTVTVAEQGIAALVGPEVANLGSINARLGRVTLAGAETFTLDLAGDGLLAIDVTRQVQRAPAGGAALVTNSGTIQAEGGSVLLTASAASGLMETLVAQTGTISANTSAAGRTGQVALRAEGGGTRVSGTVSARGGAGQRGGNIEANATGTVTIAHGAVLDASGEAGGGRIAVGLGQESAPAAPRRLARRTNVEAGATIRADATARGQGGTVLVNSAEQTTLTGDIAARGGTAGGDGGFVEVSGQQGLALGGPVDVRARAAGARHGTILIDPDTLILTPDGIPGSFPLPPTGTAYLNNANLSLLSGNIELQANNAIQVTFGSFIFAPVVYNGGDLTLRVTNTGSRIDVNHPIDVGAGSLTLRAEGMGSIISVDTNISVRDNFTAIATGNTSGIILGASLPNTFGIVTGGSANVTATGTGGYIQVSMNIAAAGGFSLDSAGGFVNHVTGYGIVTDNQPISFTSGGDLSLTGDLNAGSGDVRIASTGGEIGLGGNVTANSLVVTGPGGIFLSEDLALNLARGALLSTPGSIDLTAFSFSLAGSAPLLVLDSRASGLTALPAVAGSSITAANIADLLPVVAGSSTLSSAPASSIFLNLDAPTSAVVLLADGAAVSGYADARIMGLFGTGGLANVTGMVGGVGGTAAALSAFTVIPNTQPALQSYLYNGAVWQGIAMPSTPPPVSPPEPPTPTTGPEAVPLNPDGPGAARAYRAQHSPNLGRGAAEAAEARAEGGNSFTDQFLTPPSPVTARAGNGIADAELELPNVSGGDY